MSPCPPPKYKFMGIFITYLHPKCSHINHLIYFLNDAKLKQAFHVTKLTFNFFSYNPTYFTVSKNLNPVSRRNNNL